ncbi:hypothetical protein NPIL_582621 [Nephila pilipes]|uniref:Uncharacterized protein n=1 Tax=Nephila pilipes TaxID=299642 RepID=A0A8X6T8B3_NEPPI|nr:hypothetical protein NPIL_582621 [Nephila pilipes]
MMKQTSPKHAECSSESTVASGKNDPGVNNHHDIEETVEMNDVDHRNSTDLSRRDAPNIINLIKAKPHFTNNRNNIKSNLVIANFNCDQLLQRTTLDNMATAEAILKAPRSNNSSIKNRNIGHIEYDIFDMHETQNVFQLFPN